MAVSRRLRNMNGESNDDDDDDDDDETYCAMFRVLLHSDLPRVRVSATSN
jgi:hypothetical protein